MYYIYRQKKHSNWLTASSWNSSATSKALLRKLRFCLRPSFSVSCGSAFAHHTHIPLEAIPVSKRKAGFKFGVTSGNTIIEYTFETDGATTATECVSKKSDYYSKNDIDGKVGNMQNLSTTEKNSLVGAINELKQGLDGKASTSALTDGLAGKQGTINDLEAIRSGAGKGATSVQGVKMEGDDNPLTPDENGVVTFPQPEIPDSVTSVIANNELVFQTPDGQSVKGKVGISTGADGLLHLTLTDEEGHTYSSPIAGLRVVGNALQYSNDGETWVTVQTFGKLAIKYAQASDPASGDEGDLALVGSTNAYVLKVYVGGSWVSVCDFGTLDLTSDAITMAGDGKTLTQKMAKVDGELFEEEEIESSEWVQGALQGKINDNGTYFRSTTCEYMYLVPIEGFNKLEVETGTYQSFVALVTNTTMTNGGDVPFAEGESLRTLEPGSTHSIDVPSDAKYMVVSQKLSSSFQYPESVIGIECKVAQIAEIAEKAQSDVRGLNEEFNELSESVLVIEDKAQEEWIVSDKKAFVDGGVYKTSSNFEYACFIPIANAKTVKISTGEKYAQLTFVTTTEGVVNGGSVPFANGETARRDIPANSIDYELAVPSDAKYIFTSEKSGACLFPTSVVVIYTTSALIKDVIKNNTGSSQQADKIVFNDKFSVGTYTGESPFLNTFRKTLTKSGIGSSQSMAIYNGYLFTFRLGMAFSAFDKNFNKLQDVSAIESTSASTGTKPNMVYFSDEFYDVGDEFPILYCRAQVENPYIAGYRIRRTNGVWSIERVHTIYHDGEKFSRIVAYDKQNDNFIVSDYPSNTRFYIYHRPTYASSVNGVSTIYDSDLVEEVVRSSGDEFGGIITDVAQDCSVYGNTLVSISSGSGVYNNHVLGVDITTGKMKFVIDAGLDGEGEGCEWYCGRLYVSTNNGYLYEIIFSDGMVKPRISGITRPTNPENGRCFFDETLGKPIWYNGSGWVDASGQSV